MADLLQLLNNRKRFLTSLEKEIENKLEGAPSGALRISHRKGKVQFYQRINPADQRGKYIPTAQKELAAKLAQKEYDKSLYKAIQKELNAIDAFLKKMPKYRAEENYLRLNDIRKELVVPALETDEMYAQRWQSMPYRGKLSEEEQTGLFTDKGEKVRSKSEMIIANLLAKDGVPYRYECPLELKGMGVIYPDFTVLNIRLRKVFYWEHQGDRKSVV